MKLLPVQIFCLLNLLIPTIAIHAQFTGPATGIPAFSSVTNGPDAINLGNLNIHIAIPIMSKAGRSFSNSYSLTYDSSLWNAQGSWESTTESAWGWQGGVSEGLGGYLQGDISFSKCGSAGSTKYIYHLENISYRTPDNLIHSFSSAAASLNQCTGAQVNAQGPSSDGYYITAQIGPGPDNDGVADAVITTPSGNKLSTSLEGYGKVTGSFNQTLVDTNGNGMYLSGGGPVTITGTRPYYNQQTLPTGFTYVDSNGSTQTITVNYGSFNIATNFGVPNVGDVPSTPVLSNYLPTSVVYPDGSSYQFAYEQTPGYPGYTTGRIASLTLPTGGVISYQYVDGYNGIEADGTTAGIIRTTSDGSTRYDRSNVALGTNGSGGTSTTTITDALNNQSVIDFVETSYNFYETRRRLFSGSASGNPLRTISTCYNGTASNCVTSALTLPVTQQYVATTLDTGLTSAINTKYNSTGTVAEIDEYDFGASSPARKTVNSYTSLANNILDRPSSTVVTDSSGNTIVETTFGYDESISCSGTSNVTGARGNLTSTHQWMNSSGTTMDFTSCHDQNGQVVASANSNGTTTYAYDSTDIHVTNATPPTPSSGVSLPMNVTYDPNTGLPTSAIDPNGTKVAYTYDSILRPGEIDKFDANGSMVGKTQYTYYSTQDIGIGKYQNASGGATTRTLLDGYGRTSRVAVYNGQGSNQWYQSDTCYDSNGNMIFQSYRYQGAGWPTAKVCSGSGDSYLYDAMGRVTKITHGDGTNIQYTYTGRATKVVDENGVTRITQVDGLGRTVSVCEVTSSAAQGDSPAACGQDIAATGFLTTYAYDLANHKTTITQGVQTRVFQTDWLGRTILTQEPERGQTTYSYAYNSTGLVVTRQRPKANQASATVLTTTTTQYDTMGRVLSIGYDDGTAPKSYLYDTPVGWPGYSLNNHVKGRLAAAIMTPPGATYGITTAYIYDAMSRITGLGECTPSTCGVGGYNLSYTYDWLGNTLTATDGAGVTTSYNNYTPANEVGSITSSLSDANHPGTLLSNIVNGPNGPLSYQLGNSLSDSFAYNTLGQRTGGWVCSGSSQNYCTGGTQLYGYGTTVTGNRIDGISDTVLNKQLTFGYDSLNRLTSTTVNSGTQQNFTYSYDRYGNRWQQTLTAGTGPSPSVTFSKTINHIISSGYFYDAPGNLTADGIHTYAYDAEGNLTQVDGGATVKYTYNALNQRVRVDWSSGGQEFVYNLNSQRASIWDAATGNQVQGQAYWGSVPIEFYEAGVAHFQHQDWLGTERMRTTHTGSVEGQFTSLPFGDGYTFSGADNDASHFATLDHDSTSATDHAQFRQYGNITGQWMSPDPYNGSYHFSNPQSLNRYSYVLNNPLSFVDPSGLDFMTDNDTGQSVGGPQQQQCSPTNPCTYNLLWPPPPGVQNPALGGDPAPNNSANSGLGPGGGGGSRPSFGNPMANALFSPQVGGRYFGGANNLVNKATAATAIVYGGGIGIASVAPAVGAWAGSAASWTANASGMLGPTTARVFWSAIGSGTAAEWAEENGGTTLEMTPLGSFANWAQRFLPQNGITGAAWNALSSGFARGAEGAVTYLQGAYLGNTWLNTELPILEQNGNTIYTVPIP